MVGHSRSRRHRSGPALVQGSIQVEEFVLRGSGSDGSRTRELAVDRYHETVFPYVVSELRVAVATAALAVASRCAIGSEPLAAEGSESRRRRMS